MGKVSPHHPSLGDCLRRSLPLFFNWSPHLAPFNSDQLRRSLSHSFLITEMQHLILCPPEQSINCDLYVTGILWLTQRTQYHCPPAALRAPHAATDHVQWETNSSEGAMWLHSDSLAFCPQVSSLRLAFLT